MSKKKPLRKNTSILFNKIPKDLKQKFKAECAKQNITMQDTIINLMQKFCQ